MTDWRSWLRIFRAALVFLTTLPLPYPQQFDALERRRTVYCYPLVGLVIGLLLWLLLLLVPANLLGAALLLLAWTGLTGALHLDGLADCADAWIGGLGDRERTLRILKDPTSGPIAIVVLIFLLLIKLAALVQLLAAGAGAALVIIPVIARLTPLALLASLPYVRGSGIGTGLELVDEDRRYAQLAIIVVLFLSLITNGWSGLGLITVAALTVLLVARMSKKRLGGFTGDVAGALIELTECALLVTAALLI